MTRLARLKKEAMLFATLRGHKMSNFKMLGKSSYLSTCKRCGREVVVDLKPAPNGIDIGGEAIALLCNIDWESISG